MARDYDRTANASTGIETTSRKSNDPGDVERREYRRVLSASSLSGDGVRNSAGEDLGKIEDIMLDVPTGRVAYAVLSFGGFLGMGNKLFAIPWEAMSMSRSAWSL